MDKINIRNIFKLSFIMLLVWIGFSINKLSDRVDHLGAHIDAMYNELSTEMLYISEDWRFARVDNLLVIELLESIINKHNTKDNNE
jgi:hypothetical protein